MKALPSDASSDQSGNIPEGYYRRNTGMLHQMPTQSPAKALPEIDTTDKDALRKLARGKLVQIIQGNESPGVTVSAIKELLDRIDGKPHQSIDMTAQVKLRYEPLVIRLANPEPLVIDNDESKS